VSDPLRYRLVDEARPSPFSRLALPPLLVFLAATFFLPWGYLLIAFNAVALNGPSRNREIGLALLPMAIYFGALALLDAMVRDGSLSLSQARYLFVAAVGLGLGSAAFAFISQQRTFELRRYLGTLRGAG
jgi:hypothetical protein